LGLVKKYATALDRLTDNKVIPARVLVWKVKIVVFGTDPLFPEEGPTTKSLNLFRLGD
jgi:hypothetical protein